MGLQEIARGPDDADNEQGRDGDRRHDPALHAGPPFRLRLAPGDEADDIGRRSRAGRWLAVVEEDGVDNGQVFGSFVPLTYLLFEERPRDVEHELLVETSRARIAQQETSRHGGRRPPLQVAPLELAQ